MVHAKTSFILRKENRITTETLHFRAPTKEEFFRQVRSYAAEATRNGFLVEQISSESIWRPQGLIAWPSPE